jgi:hypothetical protein
LLKRPVNFGAIVCRRTFFVGEHGENDQQLGRSLRGVGFVHRNFGDDV